MIMEVIEARRSGVTYDPHKRVTRSSMLVDGTEQEISPTPERIVQDILDFPNVLVKVIEVGGTVLPECKLRHGHRALRHNKKSFLKNKLSTKQRIESNKEKPIHPDALRGRNIVLGREVKPKALPDIESDNSTESGGEGGNTDYEPSDVEEYGVSALYEDVDA